MGKNTTFLNNIDENKVTTLLQSTDDKSTYFLGTTETVVLKYTSDLDTLMEQVQETFRNPAPADDISLETLVLNLSAALYFVGEKLEVLGIKSDIAKAARQEVFNNSYLNNQIKDAEKKNKTTVAENTAYAEEESKYESVVANIYERAYKIIKFKVDAAQEMVNTLRKIISKHMQDTAASMVNPQASTTSILQDKGEI